MHVLESKHCLGHKKDYGARYYAQALCALPSTLAMPLLVIHAADDPLVSDDRLRAPVCQVFLPRRKSI